MSYLSIKIREEIEKTGCITFARFMEMALYFPGQGYYENQLNIGKTGDFFTSVSVGKLFGELLAFQFAEWLDERGMRSGERGTMNLQIVEAGAHAGQLALDVLNWFEEFRPEIFAQLEYYILEPSQSHREWQQKTLGKFSDKVAWFADWSAFPRSVFRVPHFPIVFSNELFDALPVHRVGWDAKNKDWFEWGVGFDGENFAWRRLENSAVRHLFPTVIELAEVLPDGFSTEIRPAAATWWKEAASILQNGKIVAIDYGLSAEEFLTPERRNGTLRAYSHHHANVDLLAYPGEQDFTAHVNFTALRQSGESAGLKTESFLSQTKFLTLVAEQSWKYPDRFGEWNASRRKQFQTLTHPEHLGRPFRVLIQSR